MSERLNRAQASLMEVTVNDLLMQMKEIELD